MATLAWLFPGQGAQSIGMGQSLYDHSPIARATYEEADEVLGMSLSQLMFSGDKAELDDTVNTQPALYVHSIAAWRAAQEAGVLPPAAFAAGHSLGEYSALAAVGALEYAAGLRLVSERGRLMKMAGELNPGKMAAILNLDDATVTQICADASSEEERVQVANYNTTGQVVISGASAAVERAMQAASDAGARRVVALDISIAAHSPLMAMAQAPLANAIDAATLHTPPIPVIGNTTVTSLTTVEAIRSELKAQLVGSVRWTDTISYLAAHGVDTVLEIGNGDVLIGLVKRIDKSIRRYSLSTWEHIQNAEWKAATDA
jgi:[acyl-carrier-protein] S-malonyltransferase